MQINFPSMHYSTWISSASTLCVICLQVIPSSAAQVLSIPRQRTSCKRLHALLVNQVATLGFISEPGWISEGIGNQSPSSVTSPKGHSEIKPCIETQQAWLPPAGRDTRNLPYSTPRLMPICTGTSTSHGTQLDFSLVIPGPIACTQRQVRWDGDFYTCW